MESRANEESTKQEVIDAEIDSARDFEEPIQDASFPTGRGPL
jgi:hypothetical protein